ncbi:MAG TPA: PDZ domain-containing protein [Candidatus Polarisedimenticolia bacterium]|jgi:C-terminal processing protease CtpA/Prc|nr:PDZ domain-containing protein [Candidatus Polarisedimenticolia bacterium]
MRRNHWIGLLTVACFAAFIGSLALAGGHGCTMKAEDCAKEMTTYFKTHGWLGVEKDHNEDGTLTVTKIAPGGPAEKAGFQVGDRIVSINGVALPSGNEEKLKALKEGMKIGDTVTYEVSRNGQNVTLQAGLTKIPDDALAAMIEKHQKEEHQVARK